MARTLWSSRRSRRRSAAASSHRSNASATCRRVHLAAIQSSIVTSAARCVTNSVHRRKHRKSALDRHAPSALITADRATRNSPQREHHARNDATNARRVHRAIAASSDANALALRSIRSIHPSHARRHVAVAILATPFESLRFKATRSAAAFAQRTNPAAIARFAKPIAARRASMPRVDAAKAHSARHLSNARAVAVRRQRVAIFSAVDRAFARARASSNQPSNAEETTRRRHRPATRARRCRWRRLSAAFVRHATSAEKTSPSRHLLATFSTSARRLLRSGAMNAHRFHARASTAFRHRTATRSTACVARRMSWHQSNQRSNARARCRRCHL